MRRHAIVCRLSLLTVLLSPAAAQVPLGYLVTAEQPLGRGEEGFAFIDPATGIVTRGRMEDRTVLGTAVTVAVDAQDATGLFVSAGVTVGGPPVLRLEMAGNHIRSRSGGALQNFGKMARMLVRSKEVWFTFSSSAQPGLYRMTFFNAQATFATALASAFDLTELGGKIYVASHAPPASSTILEYDPSTQQTRMVGSSFPALGGLASQGAFLVAGTSGGELLRILPQTGASTSLGMTGKGAIAAIAVRGTSIWFATDRNEVWDLSNLTQPVYKASNTIHDLDVGTVDQGALLIHGAGCMDSNGRTAAFSHAGAPALGKPLPLLVTNAFASSPALLVLGLSRRSWGPLPLPLDLTPVGMPGCKLWNDFLLGAGTASDAQGRVQASLPIPADTSLRDLHLMFQVLVVDTAANKAGLVVSDGAEAILR